MRIGRGIGRGAGALLGGIIGGSDFRNNQKRGVGLGNNLSASIKSTRNQNVVSGDKVKHTAGQVAAGALRMATLPVGVLKDAIQGGVITAGKNIGPRLRNVVDGTGIINHADVREKKKEAGPTKDSGGKKNETDT